MIFLVFTCFAVPYQLAFETTSGHIITPYNIFDITVDCFFMTDVLANFVTCYYHEGQYVTNLRSIGIHYLQTWFLIDVAGSFPFDKVTPPSPSRTLLMVCQCTNTIPFV
jgi:potassium voltage-gated channel Eag-related subfamily H protein 4